MNKFFTPMLIIFIMATISGCDNNPASRLNEDFYVESKSSSSKIEVEEPEMKYADLIPDPELIFEKGVINITDADGGSAYILNVTNYENEEYETFVSSCKDLGFNDISYELAHDKGKDFGAYSSDGVFWIQVNLDSEKEIIYIICQISSEH